MLIHANGFRSEFAPVKIYHFDPVSGSLLVGNENTRIMLVGPEEIRELHSLLEPFARNTEVEGGD